jgi:thiol-disulfide isomerase/thioredoxin
MTTLLMTAMLQLVAVASPANTAVAEADFAKAQTRSLAKGRPLVVLVGADWCTACVHMKDTVLPQVARAGGLKQVEFAYVDMDRQPELASRLSQGGPIPQLIRLKKTRDGWQHKRLVGAHSVKTVTYFVAGK